MSIRRLVVSLLGFLCLSAGLFGQKQQLTFRPIAAEYSKALDRIIMVAGAPNALYSYDAVNNIKDTVALQDVPLALSVSPDGLYAAVLHTGSVSYVNLSTKVVAKTFPLPAGSSPVTGQSIVLASAWIYLPPTFSINISSGQTTGAVPGYYGYPTRLSPDGKSIYTSSQKYDISAGALSANNNNYYYGGVGNGVWFSLDGSRLYSSKNVWNVSSDVAVDFSYYATLSEVTFMRGFAESQTTGVGIAVLDDLSGGYSYPYSNATPIRLYDSGLGEYGVLNLPGGTVGTNSYQNYGKWIFYNAAGGLLFVVMQADSTSGLLNDFAIQTYTLVSGTPCVTATLASLTASVGGAGALGTVAISAAGDCKYTASSGSDWLFVYSESVGSGNSTLTYVARPNPNSTARTGTITVGQDTLIVTQAPGVSLGALNQLSVNVVDAARINGTDKIVYISVGPNEIHVWDPATGTEQFRPLPGAPTSIAVRPDGAYAAVGHDGWIDNVNLSTLIAEGHYKVPFAASSVVLAGNGYIYAASNSGTLYSYQISTGKLTQSQSNLGFPLRLHPSGNTIYGGTYGPGKVSIASGIPVTENPGNSVSVCGNFWISDAGDRIITACSAVARVSDIEVQDLQQNGSLSEAPSSAWAAHSTPQSAIATIPANSNYCCYSVSPVGEVQIYNDSDLSIRSREVLPQFSVGGLSYNGNGKFVFWNTAGTKIYAIEQVDTSASLLASYGIGVITPVACGFTLVPSTLAVPYTGTTGSVTVNTGSTCHWTPTSTDTTGSVTITSNTAGGTGNGSFSYSVSANPSTASRTLIILVEGQSVTLTQTANPGTLTVTPTVVSVPQAGVYGNLTVTTSNQYLGWSVSVPSSVNWIYMYSSGVGSGSVYYNAQPNVAGGAARSATVMISGKTVTFNQAGVSGGPPAYTGSFESASCTAISGWAADQNRLGQPISIAIYDGTALVTTVTANSTRDDIATQLGDSGQHGFSYTTPVSLIDGKAHTLHVYYEASTTELPGSPRTLVCGGAGIGLAFYPITPCRIADTRVPAGFIGQFGPPSIAGGSTRIYNILSSSCAAGIPSNVAAYALNFTVVPPSSGPSANLTTWPAGSGSMPNVSTLNYSGSVVANAAIVPAGANGAINVYANYPTDVLFDITGYFAPPASNGLEFYTVSPCRIADTRTPAGFSGQFGPPTMAAGSTRTFNVPASACGVPSAASVFSLNFTVVPNSADPSANLTTWPTGAASMPNVSTLNYSNKVIANAAIVPAGTNDAINVFVNYPTDVLFDVNGYFAPPATNGLHFYPVTPCRIADTRPAAGFSGSFGAPTMTGGSTRTFNIPASNCGIPSSAVAYSLNFTVVPPSGGPAANLTTWPAGGSVPNVSTLNYYGSVVANAAIVPAGTNGAINVFVNYTTDVLFDINGYFAP